MKKLETIQVQIIEIQTKAKQEAENLQSQVDTANKAKEDAAAAFIKAKQDGDPKAYAEAAADQRAFKDIAEMYEDKKKAHDKKPLVTVDEYKAMTDQIMSELDQANDAAKEKALKHLEALQEIAGEVSKTIHFGNELLHQVQHDLYKDRAEMILANGNKVYLAQLEKQYKDFSVYEALTSAVRKTEFLYKEDK